MRKAIYIKAPQVDWLKLDGPSLLIKMKNKSAQRFPIQHIKRIVIIGFLKQEIYALLYIAEQGVPIFFTDQHYKAKVELTMFNHKKSCFHDYFQLIIDEPCIYQTVTLWFENYHQHFKSQFVLNNNVIANQPYKTATLKKNQQKLTTQTRKQLKHLLVNLIKLIIVEQLYSIGLAKELAQQYLLPLIIFALDYYVQNLIIESANYITNSTTIADWSMTIFIKQQQAVEYQISKIIHQVGYFLCELTV